MGYEAAPACKMLATVCCVCGLPLLDAKSVESGIGPVCAKKLKALVKDFEPEAKARANKLIYAASVAMSHGIVADMEAAADELAKLGAPMVAHKIMVAAGRVAILVTTEGDVLVVTAPYNAKFLEAGFKIPGRRWMKEKKHTTFPLTQRVAVFTAIKAAYPGATVSGSRGVVVI